ncbi:hypothetical protein BJX70DRAFT_398360 [Aspergillus crustosus]
MALYGYDQAVFSGVIVTRDFLDTMGNPDANLTGTITSLYNLAFPIALKLLFSIVILSTAPWLPESPRWLISKGRIEEADFVLAHIQGNDTTVTPPTVIAERNEILRAYTAELENQVVSWSMLLRGQAEGPGTLRRFFLGLGTQVIVQLSGVNATSYYLPTVLQESVGLAEKLARLLTAVNSIHYIFFSYLGMMLIDKWGRRVIDDDVLSYKYGAASVAMIFVFYAFFGVGWQGTAWLYNTEINSLHMRMTGAPVSVTAQWAINYMVVQGTPIGIQNLQWRFYLIWVFFSFFSIPIIYPFYPETANRRLEDIDLVFKEWLQTWVFLDKEATQPKRPARFVAMDVQGVEHARAEVKNGLGPEVEQIEGAAPSKP